MNLRLEGHAGRRPDHDSLQDMRGDAVIYLWDRMDLQGALGYHDRNHRGIPFGFVFVELAEAVGEAWSVTLSHEALEMIGDPEVNLLVQGPHPGDPRCTVFHWYQMCDAVQAESYFIDGVEVSNFLLPLYFTGGDEHGGRNDFLGRPHNGRTLGSFGLKPGGYIGFFDPRTGLPATYVAEGDEAGRRRLDIKSKAKSARRLLRYQRFFHTHRDQRRTSQ